MALKGFKAILASRNLEMGKKAAEKLKELNLDVSSVEMDVTNQESIHQAAATINEHFGRLDVLINNAGVYLDMNKSFWLWTLSFLRTQWQLISLEFTMSSVPLFP
ncbi:SDR family NAD(P)-dependent oxidoreductase [Metabacillus niabensis]|uniref:SDR family NAD(P)-dependent oxidoreductase n=1 Tax=Metabacillus niabensis TaxID=324854 RepID=UPI0039A1A3EB